MGGAPSRDNPRGHDESPPPAAVPAEPEPAVPELELNDSQEQPRGCCNSEPDDDDEAENLRWNDSACYADEHPQHAGMTARASFNLDLAASRTVRRQLSDEQVEKILADQSDPGLGGMQGSCWHKVAVAMDFITPAIPKFVARDFKAFEELEIHHDNLLLDVTLDEGEQRELGRVAKRVKYWGGIFSILAIGVLMLLATFEVYSIARKETIGTVELESWTSGKIGIQRVGVTLPTASDDFTVYECLIENGNYDATNACGGTIVAQYAKSELSLCSADGGATPDTTSDVYCLPSGLYLLGTFGSAEYYYVQVVYHPVDVVGGGVNLWLYDYLNDPLELSWHSIYMTYIRQVKTETEVFMRKYSFIVYGVDGLSPDYSLDSTAKQESNVLTFARMYSRGQECSVPFTCVAGTDNLFTWILRAEEQTQHNEVRYRYTILKAVETLGGLYTGIAFLFAAPIAIAHIINAMCQNLSSFRPI